MFIGRVTSLNNMAYVGRVVSTNNQTIISSEEISKSKNIISGIEHINENDIKINPNPTRGVINIQIPEQESTETVLIEIYNLQGQRVKTYQKENGMNLNLNLNDQSAGVYLVKINLSGQIFNKKIVLIK